MGDPKPQATSWDVGKGSIFTNTGEVDAEALRKETMDAIRHADRRVVKRGPAIAKTHVPAKSKKERKKLKAAKNARKKNRGR